MVAARRLTDQRLMDLNRLGVSMETDRVRARLWISLPIDPEREILVILPIWHSGTPYSVSDGTIYHNGEPFANVKKIEFDDAVHTYVRAGGKVLTMNTNARSFCTGCAFCHYSLEKSEDPPVRQEGELELLLDLYLAEQNWSDYSAVERIGLSTGCFKTELHATSHLIVLRNALARRGFRGTLQLLSSVVRSRESLAKIVNEAGPFHLTLTTECLERRDMLLKDSKASLRRNDMTRLLEIARKEGAGCDFTYIVGLDDLNEVESELRDMSSAVTQFPKFQVFQPHAEFMKRLRHSTAADTTYYSAFRDKVTSWFVNRELRPEHWQNYRSLWYYEFGGAEFNGGIV